ncbi:MAG: hypothetical protein M2R45_05309 [Verrucomicrobia subdivision 3 bacterium]|nr:hypothetical protein [Limisphaerales bacterium]MCS1414066.1 hypothetical protein [Limisphaerales bacterium]
MDFCTAIALHSSSLNMISNASANTKTGINNDYRTVTPPQLGIESTELIFCFFLYCLIYLLNVIG